MARAVPNVAPGARTLRLTTPYMSGTDVAEVQRALHVADDGFYGPVTASAVADWKWRVGYPERQIDNAIGARGIAWLLGEKPLPAGFEARAEERRRDARPIREAGAAEMERWAKANYRERGRDVVPELVAMAGELGVVPTYREMGYPWCAFAAFLATLRHGGATADLGLRKARFNPLYCPEILNQAAAGRFGMRVVSAAQAARGDLVLFNWRDGGDEIDHLGRVLKPPTAKRVTTVEGNSANRVAVRSRPVTAVAAYVRDA
jgi:hypothetical protein